MNYLNTLPKDMLNELFTYIQLSDIFKLISTDISNAKPWNDPKFWQLRHSKHYGENICFPPCRNCLFVSKNYDTLTFTEAGKYTLLNQEEGHCDNHNSIITDIPLILIYLKVIYSKAYPTRACATGPDYMTCHKLYLEYKNSSVCRRANEDMIDFLHFLALNLKKKDKLPIHKIYTVNDAYGKRIINLGSNVIYIMLTLIEKSLFSIKQLTSHDFFLEKSMSHSIDQAITNITNDLISSNRHSNYAIELCF